MLREIATVRQNNPELRRRWFRDDYFDIFVWQSAHGEITGLQLCYDLPGRERVLSWRQSSGYVHEAVDDGEQSPLRNRTPIFFADGVLLVDTVLKEFTERSCGLESALSLFIAERLREYAAREI